MPSNSQNNKYYRLLKHKQKHQFMTKKLYNFGQIQQLTNTIDCILIRMALDYQDEKTKLKKLFSSPTADEDTSKLIQMLRDEKPLNELYSFIEHKVEPEHRQAVRNSINGAWKIIQNHRNRYKLEREYVNVYSVSTIISEMFDEQTSKKVIQRLLPLTIKIKPTNSKRVDMLIGLSHKLNLRGKYKLKQSDEEIAKYIDEKGVTEGVNGLLLKVYGRQVCDGLIVEITKELRNNVLPRSQKKIRTDPLANIISKLDFYHNYGVELATDEIAKEMHEHGIRKILKELLLEHFGWKEIYKLEEQINEALANNSAALIGSQEKGNINVPH